MRDYLSVGRILRYVVSLALGVVAINAVFGKRNELSGATSYLDNLRWYWLVVAAAAEAAAIVAFAALQRRLLAAGHLALDMLTLTGITFAGNAIQNSLPAGPIFSAIFAFRQFQRRGADEVLASWVLVATAALSPISLVVLALVGVAASSGTASAFNLVGVIVSLVVLAIVIVFLWSRRAPIARRLVRPLRLFQRLFHRPPGDPKVVIEEALRKVGAISPSRFDWFVSFFYALANWGFDIVCLMAAFFAVGAAVPWRALLLAYAAAQLAANLPITPGGLGVVEGSLIIGLVAYGGGKEATVAAVLLYRLLSFWSLLLVGWISWGLVSWDLRRRPALEQAVPS